jgi:hypothetical protein
VNDSASGLLALTGTFHSTTQEPVFAQAQSSDHASMPMNTTTSSSGSKMHSLGEGIPVLLHISAGDATSSRGSFNTDGNRSCIIDAMQWQRCSNITRRKWANLAANFSYILLLSNLGDPV